MKFVTIVCCDNEKEFDELNLLGSSFHRTYELDVEQVDTLKLLTNIEKAIDKTELDFCFDKINKIEGKYKKQE